MLSKEEIEKAKEYLEQFIGRKKEYKYKPIKIKTMINTREAIENIFQYIDQLETREQKLIDKLEEDIEKFNRKENVFMTQSSQINASLISYINEILSIVR